MCYAKPGPRCSPHAYAALQKALASGNRKHILQAQDDYDETKSGQRDLQALIEKQHKNKKSTADAKARLIHAKKRKKIKIIRHNKSKNLLYKEKPAIVTSMIAKESSSMMVLNEPSLNAFARTLTRQDAQEALKDLYGKTLGDICRDKNIELVDNPLHKGQSGIAVEQIIGAQADSLQSPDLIDGDIKTSHVKYSAPWGSYISSETTKITMFSPLTIVTTPMEESVLFAKSNALHVSLIKGLSAQETVLYSSHVINIDDIPALKILMQRDYEEFADKIKNAEYIPTELNGKKVYALPRISSSEGNSFQLRTAGSSARQQSSVVDVQGVLGEQGREYVWKPRAFYLRTTTTALFSLIEQKKLSYEQANTLVLVPGSMKSLNALRKSYVNIFGE